MLTRFAKIIRDNLLAVVVGRVLSIQPFAHGDGCTMRQLSDFVDECDARVLLRLCFFEVVNESFSFLHSCSLNYLLKKSDIILLYKI